MAIPLRLLILGAHPDDAEFHAGGLVSRYCRAGHAVRMVSATDGSAGHHQAWGPPLAERRRTEAAAAAARVGAESLVGSFPDGRLEPSLELRGWVIREIRGFRPDLLLTHRTCDYHPDHRALAQAVQDACYLVTVPAIEPETPSLARDPVVAYLPDPFTRPAPLVPDVVLDVSRELETIVDLLACHVSQVFEWLPHNHALNEPLPPEPGQRRAWLRAWARRLWGARAERFRQALVARYGEHRGSQVDLAEAFEVSEYAAPLDEAARQRLFAWLD